MTVHDTSLAKDSAQSPVVLRFADMTPARIALFEAHRLRRGESGGHVDPSQRNRLLISSENWASETLQLIERMRRQNHLIEAEALRKRGRAKALDAVLERGPQDPWDARATGPMREVILTAHQDWFRSGETSLSRVGLARNPREIEFEKTAIKWLKANFGEDVVHARADHDETTYHVHAVIVPAKKMLKRQKGAAEPELPVPGEDLFTHHGKPCKVQLVASKHPLLRNYELAQDSVGLAFASVGLRCGTRHWAATKQAMNEGRRPDTRPAHKAAHVWRAEQEAALKKQRAEHAQKEAELKALEATLATRMELVAAAKRQLTAEISAARQEKAKAARLKARANAVIAVAEAVATGQIDPEADPLDIARQRSTLPPNLKEKIDAAPDQATGTLELLGRVYGVMRARARSEFVAGLAVMERTAQAWAELNRRAKKMIDIGKVTRPIYAALFGGLQDDQRDALDRAEQEGQRLRQTHERDRGR